MSIFKTFKESSFIDAGEEAPTSKKRYIPYHKKIQKKRHRFNSDYYMMATDGGEIVNVGINKEKLYYDDPEGFDYCKDGSRR